MEKFSVYNILFMLGSLFYEAMTYNLLTKVAE